MTIRANQKQVTFIEEGSDTAFKVKWSDIGRITIWRNPHPSGVGHYLSIEIAPLVTTKLHSLVIYDDPDISSTQDWNDWIAVLTRFVPEFKPNAIQRARRLPKGEHALHVLVRESDDETSQEPNEMSAKDVALHEWLDGQYFSDIIAFRKPAKATARQRLFADVYDLMAEVQNGGFHQYFGNSTADRLPEVRAALQTIGAAAALKLLESACGVFPRGKPGPTQKLRLEQLDAMPEQKILALDKLDNKFVKGVERIIAKLKQYVEATL